jgi:hypothetical protein
MAIFSFFKKQIIYNLYLKCLSPLKFVEKKT